MTTIVNSGYAQSFNMFPSGCVFIGMVQGTGAAIPVIPTTVFSATSSKGFMSRANNQVSSVAGDITRGTAGVYTIKFLISFPVVFDVSVNIWGPNGTWSSVLDYNETTRILSFNTWAAGGAAADLAATEFAHFTVLGQMSAYQ